MNIHEKINKRQAKIIRIYIASLIWNSITIKNFCDKNVPKNLRYGGYRNTCYDI